MNVFAIVEVDTTDAEVTPHLRWNNGVLQQAWNITHYRAGVPHKRTTEWREIPNVAPDTF